MKTEKKIETSLQLANLLIKVTTAVNFEISIQLLKSK